MPTARSRRPAAQQGSRAVGGHAVAYPQHHIPRRSNPGMRPAIAHRAGSGQRLQPARVTAGRDQQSEDHAALPPVPGGAAPAPVRVLAGRGHAQPLDDGGVEDTESPAGIGQRPAGVARAELDAGANPAVGPRSGAVSSWRLRRRTETVHRNAELARPRAVDRPGYGAAGTSTRSTARSARVAQQHARGQVGGRPRLQLRMPSPRHVRVGDDQPLRPDDTRALTAPAADHRRGSGKRFPADFGESTHVTPPRALASEGLRGSARTTRWVRPRRGFERALISISVGAARPPATSTWPWGRTGLGRRPFRFER